MNFNNINLSASKSTTGNEGSGRYKRCNRQFQWILCRPIRPSLVQGYTIQSRNSYAMGKKTIIELGQQSHNPSNVTGKKKAEHEVDSWQCSNSFTSNAMLSASVRALFNPAFCICALLTHTRTAFVFCFVFVFVLPHTGTAPPSLLCGLPIFCWSSTSPAWRGSCKEKRHC